MFGGDKAPIANAVVAFLFAVTGPLAILLTVAAGAGLSEAQTASWIFGSYLVPGLITIGFSAWHRQPLAFAWTIPAALVVAPAFGHLSFGEIVGAYLATGAAVTALGASGLIGRIMARLPMPIVMGMVAAVFLSIGLRVVTDVPKAPTVTLVTIAAYLLLAAVPRLAAAIPPVLGALAVGVIAAVATGSGQGIVWPEQALARPMLIAPEFSPPALLELVLPLLVTVIGIQNTQGLTILAAAGHRPPADRVTVATGLGTLAAAVTGSVPTCLTGPSNAMICASPRRERHWIGGVYYGLLMAAFGLFAPLATRLALSLPMPFIAVLGALAMLPVLRNAFNAAFVGKHQLGALIAFMVTLTNLPILNIGAAFWALVFGTAVSWLLERKDFAPATG